MSASCLDLLDHLHGSVSVVGSMNVDYTVVTERLPKPGETVNGGPLTLLPGGKSANQASAAARIGAQVRMFGAVGEDTNADFLLEHLRDAGVDIPKFEDNEKTAAELKARIQKTLDFIASVQPEQFAGVEDKEIKLVFPWATYDFTGRSYLMHYALPNFYFHATTAYNILRHNGVDIGKRDFLGS